MLDQFKNKLNGVDGKWKAGAILGLAAIAGLLYFKFGPPSETPKTKPKTVEIKRATSRLDMESEQSPQKSLIRVINKVKKSFGQGGKIEYDTIKAIYMGQYELSRKEFIQLALRHRVERRKLPADSPRYPQIAKRYDQDLEELHNRHLNAILAHFRIEKEGWMQITEDVSASNRDEWESLINQAQNEELGLLRSKDKPKVGKNILVDIYKFKARVLKDNADAYNAIKDIQPADLCSLVEKILQDKVFEQFKVEEEDIKYSESQLSEAQNQQLEKYQEDYLDLFRGLILKVDDDDDEVQSGSAERPRGDWQTE